MRLLAQAVTQAEEELPILKDLGVNLTGKISVKVLTNQTLQDFLSSPNSVVLEELLKITTAQLDINEFINFFSTACLGEGAQILAVEIEGVLSLALGVHDPDTQMQLILPLKAVSLNKVVKDIDLIDSKLKLTFKELIFGFQGTYYAPVSQNKHVYSSYHLIQRGEEEGDKNATLFPQINNFTDKKRPEFRVALPIEPTVVRGQLHELGHYIAHHLAGNYTWQDRDIELATNSSYEIQPGLITDKTTRNLKQLKLMEVLAWVYANEYLQMLGNDVDLLNSQIARESLKTYDMVLAYPVYSYLNGQHLDDYFIFQETVRQIETAHQAYTKLRKALDGFISKHSSENKRKKRSIESLGVEIEYTTNGISINGDGEGVSICITDIWKAESITVFTSKNGSEQQFRISLNFIPEIYTLGIEYVHILAALVENLDNQIQDS